LDWLAVLRRIEAGEDARTEFKRGLGGDTKNVCKALCAFANTEGGVVILGVENAGAIVGVKEDPERVQERLTDTLQSGCSAPVSAALGRHLDPQGWVHWVEVPRQRGYEPLRYGGRPLVRRGRANVEPSPTELQELYNIFGCILTEERAIEAASFADVDLERFRAYLDAQGLDTGSDPQPATADDLRNRGVLVDLDGSLHGTLYGVLAFGRSPQAYPQTRSFFVACAAYAGVDRASEVVSASEAEGRLDEQVLRAVGWVRSLGRIERYAGLIRQDLPLVPEAALREAIVNAVAHRDYAITGSKVLLEVFRGRIDVSSPGTLPNHMTPESVKAGGHPRSRNELIANYLLVSGLMEQRGRGWPVMRRAMREFNGTEPELQHDVGGRFVRVTLRIDEAGSVHDEPASRPFRAWP
jgi:ATP-dependent DNA helicase RecG